MEKTTYIATIIDQNRVEVSLCDTVPDFVHAVKYDQKLGMEIYLSADADWTPTQENRVMELLTEDFCLVPG